MMTSSNGNIFRVTGHLCGEFTGLRWIPRTKASDAELWSFLLICIWINGWVNNRKAGDLRSYPAHSDVTVMHTECDSQIWAMEHELYHGGNDHLFIKLEHSWQTTEWNKESSWFKWVALVTILLSLMIWTHWEQKFENHLKIYIF